MKIFVFGSNLQGRHGKGAALAAAREHGAIYGQGEGLQGRSYAIPTKRTPYERMELSEVIVGVNTFLSFAQYHPEYEFIMTEIGCGLAGFKAEQIAPLFCHAPDNVVLPKNWKEICQSRKQSL